MFVVVKEVTVGGFQVGIRGAIMSECMPKLAMECLAILIIPLVHRDCPRFRGIRGGLSDMGMVLKVFSLNGG